MPSAFPSTTASCTPTFLLPASIVTLYAIASIRRFQQVFLAINQASACALYRRIVILSLSLLAAIFSFSFSIASLYHES